MQQDPAALPPEASPWDAVRSSLEPLRWRRVKVTLRNTRNTFARQHPHFVLRGVLFTARSLPARPLREVDFFWQPRGSWFGDRVHKGAAYALDLVFPRASPDEIAAFCDNMRQHLANPAANFTLAECSLPELRSLAALEQEMPQPSPEPRNVCLHFHTPVRFKPLDRARPWLLTSRCLGDLFAARLRRLFSAEVADAISCLPWEAYTLLSDFWQRYPTETGCWQSARTTKGEALAGLLGPLYLCGPLSMLWPLLQLGSELQLATGDEARKGQGAFTLVYRTSAGVIFGVP